LVECSRGDDLVVSDEVYREPAMREFLAAQGREAEAAEVAFRGFLEPKRVWRLAMR
jgi:hypothetical protein